MADNQKYNIIIHTTQLGQKEMIKQILNDFKRYYDGWEPTAEENEETHEITVISCRYYYYGVSHSQVKEMVRILHESRNQVKTQVKIFKKGQGGNYRFD